MTETSSSPGDSERYWPYYCEENVWHRCQALPEHDALSLVAFISNATRSVAMWCQQASASSNAPILWDYHVVLLRHGEGGWVVVDPDCTLGPEIEANRYLEATFHALLPEQEDLAPHFRLLPAQTYRFSLHTDRRHMRTQGGLWHADPPPWPAIGEGSNLARFIDLEGPFLGRVVDLDGLRQTLAT